MPVTDRPGVDESDAIKFLIPFATKWVGQPNSSSAVEVGRVSPLSHRGQVAENIVPLLVLGDTIYAIFCRIRDFKSSRVPAKRGRRVVG